MITAVHQLRTDVRRLVVECVHSRPDARVTLAAALDVPEGSIDRMLAKEVWDLGFALSTADALGMKLHVVGD